MIALAEPAADQGIAPFGALAGLKVLDFTQALAGPYCTQLLADLGAEVVKVEPIEGGDSTRSMVPFHSSDTARRHSGYFHSVNRNKKSIGIDLKSAAGRAIVLDLIDEYDVVVENFRAGAMDKLGLSYEELSAANKRVIYAAIRGFGDPRSGASPYAMWPAFDVVAQAMGGICAVTGSDPSHPMKVGPGIGDILPGMFLAIGILAAVVSRQQTGKGQFVDVAMVDSILAVSERIVYQRSFGGVIAKATGNHQPFMAPFGLFQARDGHIALAAVSDPFFEATCRALDATELLEIEKFSTIQKRTVARDEVISAMSQHTARFTKAELKERLGGLVPFGPVYDMADIADDPHFAAREMLPQLILDGVDEPLSVAGLPIKMSGTPGGVHAPGPDLGADTQAILSAIGRSPDEIDRLRAQGAVSRNKGDHR